MLRTERHFLVNEALELVGPQCHEILVLAYVECVEREKMAKRFAVVLETLKKRLQKCKSRWKSIFEDISEMHDTTEEVGL